MLDIPARFGASVPAVTHSAFRIAYSALPIQLLLSSRQVAFLDGMNRMYRKRVINEEEKLKEEEEEFGSGER